MRTRTIYSKTGERLAEFKDGELVFAAPEYLQPDINQAPMVMADIQPYRSMIDGSIINSRSTHRAHLRQHGCFEVGNETKHITKSAPITPPPGLKQKLIEVANAKL